MVRFLAALSLIALLLAPLTAAQAEDREDTTRYAVVYNHEWQYSIWPADRELPLGWNHSGYQGLKSDCLAFIEQVWTDMRPRSLRAKMAQMQGGDSCITANRPPHECQP